MDNLGVLNNTFFLKKEPVLRKKKKKCPSIEKHGASPWRGEGKRRGGALYKYPKNLGGEKEK